VGVQLTFEIPGVHTPSAYHHSQPLLIISNDTDTRLARRGRGPLHDLPDQERLMATITAPSETVRSPRDLPDGPGAEIVMPDLKDVVARDVRTQEPVNVGEVRLEQDWSARCHYEQMRRHPLLSRSHPLRAVSRDLKDPDADGGGPAQRRAAQGQHDSCQVLD
jgi:hypothetical protein